MLTQQDLTSYLTKQYDQYKEHRKKNYEYRLLKAYKLYKSYRERNTSAWKTNVFLPYCFGVIETILPRIVEYIYRGDRLVTAHPREMRDIEQAETVDFLLQYQQDTQIDNLFLEFIEFFKSTLIYGTGISKLIWDVDNDKPQFDSLDIFDFYVQPYKKYINQMDGVFQVYDKPLDYLLERQKSGIEYLNLDVIRKETMSALDEEAKRNRESEIGKEISFRNGRPTTLIYEYWGKTPQQERIDVDAGLGSTYYKEQMVMIANRKYVIRAMDNPYKSTQQPNGFRPFIVGKDYVDLTEFYGIGEIDNISDIQIEANEIENQSMDNIKLILNRMWLVGNNAGVDYETMFSYPGGIINADNPELVKPLQQQEIPQSYVNKREQYLQEIQRTSGVNDYTQGMNTPGMTDTVGGISSLIEEANMRFSLKIKILQMTAIKDFAEKLFMLDKIFIKNMRLPVRLEGEKGMEWVDINPDNLKGMYDFKPVGISMVGNKLARQNTLIKVMEVLAKSAPIPPIAQQILEEFEFKNVDEIMSYLYKIWGINPSAESPNNQLSLPMGNPPADLPPKGAIPQGSGPAPDTGAPTNNNAQVMQNLSKIISAGISR